MKILLVDDSKTAAYLFAERLRTFGYEVTVAENGAQAVERFPEFAPDLVLMDIEMPVMNGFEATSRIRAFEASQKSAWTPIIFLTSVDTAENIVTAIEAGGDDLLPKNVPESVLRAKMKAMTRVAALRHEVLAANRELAEDIRLRQIAEAELSCRCQELTELNEKLSRMQGQLIQSEKMASVGQLAAGVAHEINTPIGYVRSNLGTLERYLSGLLELLELYEAVATSAPAERLGEIEQVRKRLDLAFLKEDAGQLVNESREGVDRVKRIVQSLKDFSTVDSQEAWQETDLHRSIDAMLDLLAGEIRPRADIVKAYGSIPPVECMPQQINQLFMNLLLNTEHAFEAGRGTLTIRTGSDGEQVWIEFEDNGRGIPKETLGRIFDPFFTTKPVGKGTGLGLSLSYGVVKDHRGRIDVASAPGKGSRFRITLPRRKAAATAGAGA